MGRKAQERMGTINKFLRKILFAITFVIFVLPVARADDFYCPEYSNDAISGPLADIGGLSYDFDGDGEISSYECFAIRVYSAVSTGNIDDAIHMGRNVDSALEENIHFYNAYDVLDHSAWRQETWDSSLYLNSDDERLEGSMSIALCLYDESTGNYDYACSMALVSDDGDNTYIMSVLAESIGAYYYGYGDIDLAQASSNALQGFMYAIDPDMPPEHYENFLYWTHDPSEEAEYGGFQFAPVGEIYTSGGCGRGETDDGNGGCMCDESNYYYGDAGDCTYCEPYGYEWDGYDCLPVTYTITYNLNGGTNYANAPTTYDVQNSIILDAPTKSGYMFAGWYDNTEFTGNPIQSIYYTDEAQDITLYARWIEGQPNASEYKFSITTTNMSVNDAFAFRISAKGNFYVDWGDGTIQYIDKTNNTNNVTYSHTYTTAGAHTIRFTGLATGYNSNSYTGAIQFGGYFTGKTPTKIASISGSLGAIFPTLNDGSNNLAYQPQFAYTFYNCSGLTSLPSGLFNGISGAASYMFYQTFYGCTNLTTVPYNLFSGASGTGQSYMFYQTFYNDSKLNTFVLADGSTVNYIPTQFFGSISGGSNVMNYIFYNNTAIASSCPTGTVQNVTGYESQWNSRVSCEILTGEQHSILLYRNYSSEDDTVLATVKTYQDQPMPLIDINGDNLSIPTRDEYIFNGYWSQPSDGTKYYNTNLTSAHTWDSDSDGALYAQWAEPFTITTMSMTAGESFKWSMSAKGNFIVDCGTGGNFNGTGNQAGAITRSNTTTTQYYCSYANAGTHTIKFGGTATGYQTSLYAPAIQFGSFSGNTATKIASISGSLGAIFPTLNDGSSNYAYQPQFYATFHGATNLTSLPSGLFNGISGASYSMFSNTFSNCTGLTSLPSGLFNGISGASYSMFSNTFSNCTGLTSLPSGLFNGISGAAGNMFSNTFYGCTGLTSLPSGLFNGISGAASYMFSNTFYGCTNLTTVPYNLFAGISGTGQDQMFYRTFYNDSKLDTFVLADGSTVNYIPAQFFGSISGGSSVMNNIFYNATAIATSCPTGTVQNVTGYESYWNSRVSCIPCPSGQIAPAGSTSVNQCTSTINTITLYQNENSENDTINETVYGFNGSSMQSTNISGVTLTAPTREGYLFNGYWSARSGGTKYYNADMTSARVWESDSDGVLYAQWIYMPIVTLYQNENENDDTVITTIRATPNTAMPSTNTSGTTLIAPTRTGYIFTGYWSARSGGIKYYNINMTSAHVWDSDSDGVLYAQWVKTGTYNITYMDGDVVLNGLTPVTYDVGTGATINAKITKSNGTFAGWCTNAGLTDCAQIRTIGVTDTGDKTFYAKFNCKAGYTYTPGASNSNIATIIGNDVGISYTSVDGNTQTDTNTFTVTYDDKGIINGRAACSTTSGSSSSTQSSITDQTNQTNAKYCWCHVDGYTQNDGTLQNLSSSWVYQSNLRNTSSCARSCANNCASNIKSDTSLRTTIFGSIDTPVTTAPTCYPNTYTITFNANGGRYPNGAPANVSVKYGKAMPTISSQNNPIRDGFSFDGYRTGGTEYYNYFGTTEVRSAHIWDKTSNATLYAEWGFNGSQEDCIGRWRNTDGGSFCDYAETEQACNTYGGFWVRIEGDEHEEANVCISPEQQCGDNGGYWDGETCNCDVEGKIDNGNGGCMCDEANYYYGTAGSCTYCDPYGYEWDGSVCSPVTYTITYNLNGGTNDANAPTTYNYESNIILGSPTKSGYMFAGWYDNAEFTGSAITNIVNTIGDKVLYAKWVEEQLNASEYKFSITTTNMSANDAFAFQISAKGSFYVDWGDGTIQYIDKTNDTNVNTYSHTYTTAGVYTIRFAGLATEYNPSGYTFTAAIKFGSFSGNTATKIASISGSLGAIFPTLNDGSNNWAYQPQFYATFYGATNLTSLPTDGNGNSILFNGVSGAAGNMFSNTFSNCTGLTSLPSGLFNGISGAAGNMFSNTFSNCTGLTSLPSGLFNGISGAASYMFSNTFYGCTGLTSLPSGLFNGISGAASGMFYYTFINCTNLTTVPYNLFGGVSGTGQNYMFAYTFYNDSKLNTFVYPSGSTVNYIPAQFFGSISGGSNVMNYIFYNNTAIASSCPTGTVQNVTGYESQWNSRVSCKLPYTVTLYQNDSANDDTVNATVYINNGLSMPNYTAAGTNLVIPTRDGYTFDGYYSERSSGTKYYNADLTSASNWPSAADGSLYAQWTQDCDTANGYEVVNGECSCVSPKVEDDGVCHATCGTGEVWSNGACACDTASGYSGTAGSCDLHNYTITYNLDSGSWPVTVNPVTSYNIASETITLPTPTREGYTFNGWYDNAQLTGTAITQIATGSTDNKEFWAKWTATSYTITYNNMSGATNFDNAPANYTAESATITLGTPTKTGYTFDGWYDNEQLTGTAITEIATGSTGNKEFWAKWIFSSCPAGSYMDNDACATCASGTNNEYTLSDGGTGDINTCYKTCGSIEHATSVTGRDYYGTGIDTCEPTACSSGYRVQPASPDLMSVIGLSDEGLYSAVIDHDNVFSEADINGDESNQGQSFYGITTSDSFAVNYGNKGTLTGHAVCSTQTGTGAFDEPVPAATASDISTNNNITPAFGTGGNCWCKLDGYKPNNGILQSISTPWVYGSSSGTTTCYEECTIECTSDLITVYDERHVEDERFVKYRTAVFDSVEHVNGSCVVDAYTITYNLNGGTNYMNAPNTYNIESSTISLGTPTKSGYTFDGWYDNEQLTGTAITQIATGSTGNKTFYAKWTFVCPSDYFIPANNSEMCFPHVLHIGDNLVYLSTTKNTTPALNVAYGEDVFYANMTTTPTVMTNGSSHYFKTIYNDTVYYIYDDTVSEN